MSIWALSDLHLAISVPSKTMEVFGPSWKNYAQRIRSNWEKLVSPEDLVLIPGDICWAMRLEDALIDLKWIDSLPGTKVILRGNHDYWWASNAKMQKIMPPSIHFLHNNVFLWKGIAIGGSRLWDTPEYNFSKFTVFQDNPRQKAQPIDEPEEDEKIFVRELERLKMSLSQIPKEASYKIAMTHYPPISADLQPSRASEILESFGINICVFGHLHNIRAGSLLFGKARGVDYKFTSCDYLDFTPLQLLTKL
jgi:predicted phosphohydrolase